MPSNQIPEDVLRDGHARFHDQTGNMLGAHDCEWASCDFWESATTIAPLIIEWARKDQAETDADIALHFRIEKLTTFTEVGADTAVSGIVEAIRAQFAAEQDHLTADDFRRIRADATDEFMAEQRRSPR